MRSAFGIWCTSTVVFVMTEFRGFVLEAKVVVNDADEVTAPLFLPPPRAGIVPVSGSRMVDGAC